MIVFTNGVFDVLHRGHVDLLREASAFGGRFVVAVNTDHSARQIKGPTRPINTLEDRIAMLRELRSVQEVVWFRTEDELHDLMFKLRPDIYVKGEDWRGRVNNPYGLMVFVPHRRKLSSTKTIETISRGA